MKILITTRRARQAIWFIALPLSVVSIAVTSAYLGTWIALLVYPWMLFLDYADDMLVCPKCGLPAHGVYRIFKIEFKSAFTPRYCRHCRHDLEIEKFSIMPRNGK